METIGQAIRRKEGSWTYLAVLPTPALLPWCAQGRRSWRWGRGRRARRRPCCPWRRRRPPARGRWRSRRSGASAWPGRAASWRPWSPRRARTPRAGSSRPPPPPAHLRHHKNQETRHGFSSAHYHTATPPAARKKDNPVKEEFRRAGGRRGKEKQKRKKKTGEESSSLELVARLARTYIERVLLHRLVHISVSGGGGGGGGDGGMEISAGGWRTLVETGAEARGEGGDKESERRVCGGSSRGGRQRCSPGWRSAQAARRGRRRQDRRRGRRRRARSAAMLFAIWAFPYPQSRFGLRFGPLWTKNTITPRSSTPYQNFLF